MNLNLAHTEVMGSITHDDMTDRTTALLRLLQLVSPTLPTGAFSYSQGLEWAVEAGWVQTENDLECWLADGLSRMLATVDVPVLRMMSAAVRSDRPEQVDACINLLEACRESRELRAEENQRGRALSSLLTGLDVISDKRWVRVLERSQLAGFAFVAEAWGIALEDAAYGYVWAWLENQVIAGVKIIPLGQTAGQRLLLRLSNRVPGAVARGLVMPEEEIGAASSALALASSLHETQYTRLYRS